MEDEALAASGWAQLVYLTARETYLARVVMAAPDRLECMTRLQSTQGRLRVAASPHARTSIGIPDVRPCSAAAGCPCSAAAGTFQTLLLVGRGAMLVERSVA